MKNFLKNLCLLFSIFCTLPIFAEDERQTLALGNTSNPGNFSGGDVEFYESIAAKGARQTGLCKVLERSQWEAILKERGVQKTEEFLNGDIVPQGVSLGARFLLLLSLQNMDISLGMPIKVKNYSTRKVKAVLTIGLKIVSVETGELVFNEPFILEKSKSYSESDAEYNAPKSDIAITFKSAFSDELATEISNLMYGIFPPEINVVQVEEIKKEKAKSVYCKSNHKLPENARLKVFYLSHETIAGEEVDREIEVGTLVIKKPIATGKTTYLCEVKKGEEEILIHMNEKKALKCKVSFERGFFDIFKPGVKYKN